MLGIITVLVLIITTYGGTWFAAIAKNIGEIAIEEVARSVQFDTRVANLNFRVMSLDLDDQFSNEDAESIIAEIQSLYSQASDAENRAKLIFAVETATKNFGQANRVDFMTQIESTASDLFRNSDFLLQVMIQATGQRLLADPGAPRSWIDDGGAMRDVHALYQKYISRAMDAGHNALYFAYELLLHHLEGWSKKDLTDLIEGMDELKSDDAENIVSIMVPLADGSFTTNSAESRMVASRAQDSLCEFRQQGKLLGAIFAIVSERVELRCPLAQ